MASLVLVLVVAGLLGLGGGGEAPGEVLTGPWQTVDAADFAAAADELCRQLERDDVGVDPWTRSPEAYRTAVDARRRALATAVATLAALPEPSDDPGLRAAVADVLEGLQRRLERLEYWLDRGQVEVVALLWDSVDLVIEHTLDRLGDHGARACERSRGG